MTAPAFGNPVRGFIHPEGWARPAGSLEFEVTRSFAEHQIVSPGALGVDIGNLRCGDPVLSMLAGKIVELFRGVAGSTVPAGASRCRLDHGDGWSSGYGHALLGSALQMGMTLPEGFQIGTISSIGATACHLHFDTSLNGVRLDSVPLLRQNIAGGDMLKGTSPVRVVNKQATAGASGANFRPSPGTAQPALAFFPAGTLFYLDYLVQGGLALGSTGWYGAWGDTPGGRAFGYLHEKVLSPLTAIEQTGHSDAELAAAAKAAAHAAATDVAAAGVTATAKYPS